MLFKCVVQPTGVRIETLMNHKNCRLMGAFIVSVMFHKKLLDGFKYLLFSSLPGEMIQFDEYFSDGWFNHQLEHGLA